MTPDRSPKPEAAGEARAVRPIIFSAPMVKALLASRKTMTRRVLPADLQAAYDQAGDKLLKRFPRQKGTVWDVGQRLWVKEALGRRPASFLGIEATNGVESAFYRADEADVLDKYEFNLCPWWRGPTLSPIYMPRRASRLTLLVSEVRVERLQDISEADAKAEGLQPAPGGWWSGAEGQAGTTPRAAYALLWNSIHGPAAWDANPWVCAVAFRVHHANVDALPAALASPVIPDTDQPA